MSASAAPASEPVDLNDASVAQLQELPGIGPKKAEAIVALRSRRPYTRVSQLLEVRGIGRKTLERLKPLVRVRGTPSPVAGPAGKAVERPGGDLAVDPAGDRGAATATAGDRRTP
jgi:competence protein ComEA